MVRKKFAHHVSFLHFELWALFKKNSHDCCKFIFFFFNLMAHYSTGMTFCADSKNLKYKSFQEKVFSKISYDRKMKKPSLTWYKNILKNLYFDLKMCRLSNFFTTFVYLLYFLLKRRIKILDLFQLLSRIILTSNAILSIQC